MLDHSCGVALFLKPLDDVWVGPSADGRKKRSLKNSRLSNSRFLTLASSSHVGSEDKWEQEPSSERAPCSLALHSLLEAASRR